MAFDELMESFPPQAKITASEKITVESKTHAGTFNLAYQLLQIHPDNTYLIDVRTVEEFESGHVPDSINIPLDQIDCTADSIPDLDSTLLIYCRSGHRTIAAAKALNEIGYKVIFDLGGISNYDGDLEKGR
ncbi:MAG: rhodanese-like domain-containing protein [Clostridiaceae bacterium]|nr:rhodanese-like domain-containing protein [Clostridiaceae bacterium]